MSEEKTLLPSTGPISQAGSTMRARQPDKTLIRPVQFEAWMGVKDRDNRASLAYYLVLLLFGFVGWLLGITLTSSNSGIRFALTLVVFLLGAWTLANLVNTLLTGVADASPLSIMGAFLVFLAGALLRAWGTSETPSLIFLVGGGVLGLAGIGIMYRAAQIIKNEPIHWSIPQLPEPSEGMLPSPEPLSIGWRIVTAIRNTYRGRIRGAVLLPLAFWPWMRWLAPQVGLEIEPWIAAITASVLFVLPWMFLQVLDPRWAYARRGIMRLSKVAEELVILATLPEEQREERVQEHRERLRTESYIAAADLWAAISRRGTDSIVYDQTFFAEALVAFADAMVHLKRNQDALVYAREAVSFDPQNADAHFVLGRTVLRLGDLREALDTFWKAHHLEMREDQRRIVQGWIEGVQKELDRANDNVPADLGV